MLKNHSRNVVGSCVVCVCSGVVCVWGGGSGQQSVLAPLPVTPLPSLLAYTRARLLYLIISI
jgi:hypothetical protein